MKYLLIATNVIAVAPLLLQLAILGVQIPDMIGKLSLLGTFLFVILGPFTFIFAYWNSYYLAVSGLLRYLLLADLALLLVLWILSIYHSYGMLTFLFFWEDGPPSL